LVKTNLEQASSITKSRQLTAENKKMKALVLNGSENDSSAVNMVSDYVVDFLRMNGHEVEVRVLRNEKIAGCLGCFGCWLKTPGECVINDAGSDLPRKVVQSDLVFFLTPMTFGMYSHELKKALDRFPCPVLLPFFEKIDGEIHHSPRYESYPSLVAMGVLPNPDEESENTFTNLVARNGINLHTKAISSIVYSSDKPNTIKQKVIAALSKAGVQ
jgi:multimeric flavodoxin WrbA